ncbi:MAG: DUF4112 domain-containing protein [Alphaproteobacteria bacterium]|nr:DUF4112 domain-containing protein [Alphaproteobacteria bacterium]
MERITLLSRYMDARWRIPGTDFKFGLDGVIGLVPVVGDSLSSLLAFYIVFEAHQMGAAWHVKARMVWNIFFDWLLGLIPLVGDYLDMRNKANLRNVEILRNHFGLNRFQ